MTNKLNPDEFAASDIERTGEIVNRENFISIPPGIDCSIQGQRSTNYKRALRINRQGGMMFGRDWAAKNWLKAGHLCEKQRNGLWRKNKVLIFQSISTADRRNRE